MSKADSLSQVIDFVRAAYADKAPFEIVAGGTRRGVGRPLGELPLLDVSGLSGILKYEPEELIVTAAPATPLAEMNAVLATKNQRLGFDPADWSKLLKSNGVATLAGAASCNASGSGKLRHGGARDSLLGFQAVNGLGETFRGGSKVVKNVTGFDLPKLMCGAYGTLSVLTEMTFRVYPKPGQAAVLCLADVTPEEGFAALRRIAHSALEPAGLAYLPAGMMDDIGQDGGRGAALIKLEGAAAPLEEKIALAHGLLSDALQRLEQDPFSAIGSGEKFASLPGDVWRVMVAPSDAPHLARQLNVRHWLGDWAGGVLWLAAEPAEAARIRKLAADAKGEAMLLRASAQSRMLHGLYAPQPPALAALGRAVKTAFDPLSLFNPNRL
ncbi:MAG TPA: FAD-binding protein [Rhizomicrobium sp.]|jgi:glycolate oxidase FAD binding subunit|nr:FAD-binding protein [Rhizomicrobium sp.]